MKTLKPIIFDSIDISRESIIINRGQDDERVIYADENGVFRLTSKDLEDALINEYDIGFADGQFNGKANMVRELSDRFPEHFADIYGDKP